MFTSRLKPLLPLRGWSRSCWRLKPFLLWPTLRPSGR